MRFFVVLLLLFVFACQSGSKAPASPEDAHKLIGGKSWTVRDVGYLESSFREKQGDPFVHTINWLAAAPSLGAEDQAIRDQFMKATLKLETNPNPGDGTANIAHFDGLGFNDPQQYYFTGTQEASANDRTIKLYINMTDSTGAHQYPFTILEAGGNSLQLLVPRELNPKNVVLAMKNQGS